MKRNFYFIPRNIWFYSTFSRFSLLARCALTVAVASSLFFIWYVMMYRMLARMHTSLCTHTTQLYEKKKNMEEALQQIAQLQVATTAKQAALDALISNKQSRQSYIQELLSLLGECGLSLEGYSPQSESTKEWYSQQIVRINALGSYENIVRFLDALALSGLPIVCSYVHLEKQQKGILASCEISCYNFHKGEA